MESTTTTPKRKTRQPKRQPLVIKEVYPNGMTREEYRAELRKRARYFAHLFLQWWPDLAPIIKEENETV